MVLAADMICSAGCSFKAVFTCYISWLDIWGSADLKMTTHAHFFRQAISIHKVGQADLVLVRDQGSLVGLCTQDYNLCVQWLQLWATLINRQTDVHTHTHTRTPYWIIDHLICKAQPAELKMDRISKLVSKMQQLIHQILKWVNWYKYTVLTSAYGHPVTKSRTAQTLLWKSHNITQLKPNDTTVSHISEYIVMNTPLLNIFNKNKYNVRQKIAPFYFCNNFVKPYSILTIFRR